MEIVTKFYNWLKTHRFIAGLVITFILIVLIFYPSSKDQSVNQPLTTNPTSQETTIQYSLNLPVIHPKSGPVELGNTINGISLIFDRPIDLESVRIDSNPPLSFKVSSLPSTPHKIVLSPKTPWVIGQTYRLTIHKGIKTHTITGEGITKQYYILEEDIKLEYTILEVVSPSYPPGQGI